MIDVVQRRSENVRTHEDCQTLDLEFLTMFYDPSMMRDSARVHLFWYCLQAFQSWLCLTLTLKVNTDMFIYLKHFRGKLASHHLVT